MAFTDDLITARDNLATELRVETAARLTAQTNGYGVKTTYSVGGRNVDWNGYLRAMTELIKDLTDQIDQADVYEYAVRMYTP